MRQFFVSQDVVVSLTFRVQAKSRYFAKKKVREVAFDKIDVKIDGEDEFGDPIGDGLIGSVMFYNETNCIDEGET